MWGDQNPVDGNVCTFLTFQTNLRLRSVHALTRTSAERFAVQTRERRFVTSTRGNSRRVFFEQNKTPCIFGITQTRLIPLTKSHTQSQREAPRGRSNKTKKTVSIKRLNGCRKGPTFCHSSSSSVSSVQARSLVCWCVRGVTPSTTAASPKSLGTGPAQAANPWPLSRLSSTL